MIDHNVLNLLHHLNYNDFLFLDEFSIEKKKTPNEKMKLRNEFNYEQFVQQLNVALIFHHLLMLDHFHQDDDQEMYFF